MNSMHMTTTCMLCFIFLTYNVLLQLPFLINLTITFWRRLENHNEETRINCWFTNAIGRQCKLLQYSSSTSKHCLNRNKSPGLCRVLESNINFANEAQFLLISEESVADLNRRLEESTSPSPLHLIPYSLLA